MCMYFRACTSISMLVLCMCVRVGAGKCRATRGSANSPRPISCGLSPLSSPCRALPAYPFTQPFPSPPQDSLDKQA